MRVNLDATPIIYAVERITPWKDRVRARLAQPGVSTITSDLSVLECKVRPLRFGQRSVLADFDNFFADSLEALLPVTREVLEKAAELRARYAFLKTPDAIHLGAALTSGCAVFLPNDRRLDRCCGEIAVEPLAT